MELKTIIFLAFFIAVLYLGFKYAPKGNGKRKPDSVGKTPDGRTVNYYHDSNGNTVRSEIDDGKRR